MFKELTETINHDINNKSLTEGDLEGERTQYKT